MKTLIITFLFSLFIWACSTNRKSLPENQKTAICIQKKTDSADQWEITVFDAEYENFVATRAHPKSMFTESSLKSRNIILVNEWNSRFYSNMNPSFYEVAINYDQKKITVSTSNTDYISSSLIVIGNTESNLMD